MGIGSKIKEYRIKCGLTQKDLADKLSVTFQAVSRWETDQVEPSIDTLREMAKLFDCSVDDILGIEKKEVKEDVAPSVTVIEKEVPVIVEKVIEKETRPVLGVCYDCKKPIYDPNDLIHKDIITGHRSGRGFSHAIHQDIVVCKACSDKRDEAFRLQQEKLKSEAQARCKKRRILSFVIGLAVFAILLAISISQYGMSNPNNGTILLVTSFMGFTFTSCLILDNNIMMDLFTGISSWSIKFPGIIFTFDMDGFKFLIFMKLLFFVVGIIISILAFLAAVVISFIVSVFVYPYALIKNIKSIED